SVGDGGASGARGGGRRWKGAGDGARRSRVRGRTICANGLLAAPCLPAPSRENEKYVTAHIGNPLAHTSRAEVGFATAARTGKAAEKRATPNFTGMVDDRDDPALVCGAKADPGGGDEDQDDQDHLARS